MTTKPLCDKKKSSLEHRVVIYFLREVNYLNTTRNHGIFTTPEVVTTNSVNNRPIDNWH